MEIRYPKVLNDEIHWEKARRSFSGSNVVRPGGGALAICAVVVRLRVAQVKQRLFGRCAAKPQPTAILSSFPVHVWVHSDYEYVHSI